MKALFHCRQHGIFRSGAMLVVVSNCNSHIFIAEGLCQLARIVPAIGGVGALSVRLVVALFDSREGGIEDRNAPIFRRTQGSHSEAIITP